MGRALKIALVLGVLTLLTFFPWSGLSTGCFIGTRGHVGGGCVTEYMSPLGFRYPEWLGALFYVGLVAIVASVVVAAFATRRTHQAAD